MAIVDRALVRLLPSVPRPVVRRLSSRYIAGSELSDACRVTRRLNEEGKTATLDVLGEEVVERGEADALLDAYLEALAAIEREELDASVSVKLTGLGLKLDLDLCRERLATLVRDAAGRGNFVRVDMEDSSTTDDTLALYRDLRAEGLASVGVVLQAALRRSLADARELARLGANVRVCKGIYVEPPAIAFQDDDEVRRSFAAIVEELVAAGAYVGVATHDTWVLAEAKRILARHGRAPDEYEFQMLLGVRPELGDALVREGNRLRVYVPFGRRWYEYSLRRLQENPKIAGYVAADTLGRFLPGRNGR